MLPHPLEEVRRSLAQAGSGLIEPHEVLLEPAPEHLRKDFDLACPAGFGPAAKRSGKKPLDAARQIHSALSLEGPIEKTEVYPPAYINIRLKNVAATGIIEKILAEGPRYPEGPSAPLSGAPSRVLLEFCSANPTGPLHFGHARGAILGDTLTRIWRRLGIDVTKEYYINDVGGQIEKLGESFRARFEQEALGRDTALPQEGYSGQYLIDLARQLPAHEQTKLEGSLLDKRAFSSYAKGRLLEMIRADLEFLEIRFDRWSPESKLHEGGEVQKVIDRLHEGGRTEERDGALWFKSLEGKETEKDRVLRRADGRPTYFASDLAYHLEKFERAKGLMLNILGADHHGYVKRMRLGLEALGVPPKKFDVVLVQMVRLLRNGETVTLSKRSGDYITLGEIAREVGVDALRYFLNARSPNSQLDFDLDLATKQGPENPVYLIQYAHARICSIFREKNARALRWPQEADNKSQTSLEVDVKSRSLAVTMGLLPDTLAQSVRYRSAHHLTAYLLDLARQFHSYYESHPILSESNSSLAWSRWRLCLAVKIVIANGLDLIGVSAPEKM